MNGSIGRRALCAVAAIVCLATGPAAVAHPAEPVVTTMTSDWAAVGAFDLAYELPSGERRLAASVFFVVQRGGIGAGVAGARLGSWYEVRVNGSPTGPFGDWVACRGPLTDGAFEPSLDGVGTLSLPLCVEMEARIQMDAAGVEIEPVAGAGMGSTHFNRDGTVHHSWGATVRLAQAVRPVVTGTAGAYRVESSLFGVGRTASATVFTDTHIPGF